MHSMILPTKQSACLTVQVTLPIKVGSHIQLTCMPKTSQIGHKINETGHLKTSFSSIIWTKNGPHTTPSTGK